jgi:hypothetical protein
MGQQANPHRGRSRIVKAIVTITSELDIDDYAAAFGIEPTAMSVRHHAQERMWEAVDNGPDTANGLLHNVTMRRRIADWQTDDTSTRKRSQT